MKKTLLAAAVIILLVTAGSAYAATATSQFQVSASVAANCTITSTALDFAAYDPVGTNASNPLNVNGSVSVSCTKGAPITVGLDNGASYGLGPSGATFRAMLATGSNYLSYQLYQDSAYSKLWGASGTGLVSWTSTSKASHPFTVYGQIPAGQDVAIGSYKDTITATVNF